MVALMNRPSLFDEVMSLHEAIDDLFRNSFLLPSWRTLFGRTVTPTLALDVYEDHENYYVIGVLPGVDPNEVDITCEGNTLIISGEVPEFAPEGKEIVWQELPSGSFRRTLTLPAPIEASKVEAHYRWHRIPIGQYPCLCLYRSYRFGPLRSGHGTEHHLPDAADLLGRAGSWRGGRDHRADQQSAGRPASGPDRLNASLPLRSSSYLLP